MASDWSRVHLSLRVIWKLVCGVFLCSPIAGGKEVTPYPLPLVSLPVVGDEDGERATIERFRGRKLMLHFFASW